MSHLEGMEWAVFETQLGIVDENLRPFANLNDNPELTLARKGIIIVCFEYQRSSRKKRMYGQIFGPNIVVSRGDFVLG